MKNLLIILGIVVVLAVVGLVIRQVAGGGGSGFSGGKKVEVRTDVVTRRTIVETVTASGKLYAETEVTITPEISGEIVELYVEEGDSVLAGELLLEIDPEIYESELQSMEAQLSGSKAQLASSRAARVAAQASRRTAQRNFERNRKLFEEGVISQADFDQVEAALESAQADDRIAEENVRSAEYSVKGLEQSLRQVKENLSRTRIRAPMTGIVSGLQVKRGETVLGTSMMTGTQLMKIVDLSRMEVHVDVSESDVLRIKGGDTAWVEVDAYLDREFPGRVTEIATSATADQFAASEQATNFRVGITLDPSSYAGLNTREGRSSYALFPGMSATAEIRTRVIHDALSVPIEAVTTREDSLSGRNRLKEVVFMIRDDLIREAEVTTGIQDDDFIEVLAGLEAGAEIVTGPYSAVARELTDSVGYRLAD